MSRPERTALFRAGGLSAAAHLVVLVVVVVRSVPGTAADTATAPWDTGEEPTFVALEEPSLLDVQDPTELPGTTSDQAAWAAQATAPSVGTTPLRRVAAPDTGDGAGRPSESFRRDTATQRARLSDGAELYQPSREQTGARPSSPQAIRQEPVVGIGDSARSRQPAAGDPSQAVVIPGDDSQEQAPAPAPAAPVAADGRDETRGQGPLDAEQGHRRFDAERIGVAADDRGLRAASDEPRPGRIDLAVAAAPGNGVSGHGPAEQPGATPRASLGEAPASTGARGDRDRGPELAVSASEREYQRFRAEIRRRIEGALRFPKRLALMLQQGEAVIHFVIRPDGRLAGPVRLLKSAGFQEFDAEALAVVTRAAPFPRMTRELSVSMPVAFQNPVIR